jgi:hypothetical protein
MADSNSELLARIVRLLEPVLDDLVLAGGCVSSLMITDKAAGGIRPTKDVDAIADVSSLAMYAALAKRLRAIGLTEETAPGAPASRWRHDTALVDIMPTDRSVLGFSNTWHAPAMASAQRVPIAGLQARVISSVYFVASKLEAFHGRGQADVIASSDLEDVVMVVDGRPQLFDEIDRADPLVRQFIATEIGDLMSNRRFTDSLGAFLDSDRASQARRPLLERRLHAIAALQRPVRAPQAP